jgi:uncharacterized protein involved in outer membrane biogenesis
MRHILKWIGIVITVLVIAGVLLVAFFDWNWLRQPLSSAISKSLDRRFAIQGDLSVDVSMTPRITVNQIELANTPWGSRPEMITLEQLEFSIRLKDLLGGEVVLPEVRLTEPRLVLEKNGKGQVNWEFAAAEKDTKDEPANIPEIGLLAIEDGKLLYRDPISEIDVSVSSGIASARQQFIKIQGRGRYEEAKLKIEATGGSLSELKEKKTPYPVDIELALGETLITAKGTVKNPAQFEDPDLNLTLKGPDLSELQPLLGVSLPKTPPYRLSGQVTRKGEQWKVGNFQGGVGSSDLSGSLAYSTRDRRPFLQADLASKKLDMKDLAGFLGADPTPKKEESKRLFPDTPYDPQALRAGDADVKLRSKNIITPNLPVDEFVAHLKLNRGQLTLDPLNFGIDIGHITSRISLDARQEKIETKADLEIRKVPFKRLLAETRFAEQSSGRFLGRADLAAIGNSVAEMLGRADGDVALIMENGRISNLLVEVIGLDIARSLALVLTGDPSIPIHCVIADFSVSKGLMRTQLLLVDTDKSNIVGEGGINLGDETLDLVLTSHPKTPTILSAQAPLIIKGPFKEPDVYPDPKTLGAKAVASFALGAVLTPAAALIPWIELGLEEDSECHVLVEAAKKNKAEPPKPKRK